MQLQCGYFLEVALFVAVELVYSLLALVYLAQLYDFGCIASLLNLCFLFALLSTWLFRHFRAIIERFQSVFLD